MTGVLRAGARHALSAAALAVLAGCSVLPSWMGGSMPRPAPAALQPNPQLLAVRQAWSARLGAVGFPLDVRVAEGAVLVAADDGTVTALDAGDGRVQWTGNAGGRLQAGVGGDGRSAAVVTVDNELVRLQAGQVAWRVRLPAQTFTAPLVAGGRVFVLGADRSVLAFDGDSGRRLWSLQRPGEALVLRQGGVLLAVGNTLVAGQGGRLAGIDPDVGRVRWEAVVASSRGTNDVERLVDLVAGVSRVGDSVCVRAFQAAVGCVDSARGTTTWTQPAVGAVGVHGDDRLVLGAEADGKLVAWRRADGSRAWTSELLRHRGLTAPLLAGRSLAVGDAQGYIHLLSREDGSLLNRLSTDGSAIAAAPVLAGNTLVVVTRNGGIFGFVPQ